MKVVIVTYGRPTDPVAFDRHYQEVHVPLVKKMPRLAAFEFSRGPIVAEDQAEPPHLVALLRYASQDDLDASMASLEGQTALADVPTFASGGASVMVVDVTRPY